MSNTQPRLIALILVAGGVLAAAGQLAVADDVTAGGLPYKGVRITGVKDGELYWVNPNSGTETHKPVDRIERLTIADEPALAPAEEAYAGKKWAQAAENYDRVVKTTTKDWLKDWCTLRLIDASSKVDNCFDLFISGYIPLLLKDPGSAKKINLVMPRPDSQFILDAIGKVRAAYNDKLTKQQKQDLLELQYQLCLARNDTKGADDVLATLLTVNPGHPIAQQAAMRRLLESLAADLKNKQYDKVLVAIDKEKDRFDNPAQQAEALFCIAEAKAGKAEAANAPADAWKDVALDYMRLVSAGFPANTPRVAEAMMKTASILEKRVNDRAGAMNLYKQVSQEYRGQPIATQAETEMKRLEAAPKQP